MYSDRAFLVFSGTSHINALLALNRQYSMKVCVCVCVCALVWTDIWGQFCDFNHISVDTRGVGTSPVVRPMPINVLSIFKHIYIVNVIILICPHTVKMKVCV